MKKSVQFFSKEYLKRCKGVTPDQILEFLENYRMLISSERKESCNPSSPHSKENDLNLNENKGSDLS